MAGALSYFLSAYANIGAADTAASSGGGILVIDANSTLTANTTLSAKVVRFAGGKITLGTKNLTISGAVDAADVQIFDASGTGTVTLAKVQPASAIWFGAKGDVADDGTGTDDTAALQSWLTALGTGYYASAGAGGIVGPGLGWLPAGKYKFASTLTIPVNAKVSGVPSKSALRPSSAVTTAAVVQTAGSTLDGIVIDGLNAGNIVGLSVGASGLVNNGVTRQVQCVRFSGAAGFGLNMKTGVIWSFIDCDFGANTFGANIVDSGAGTPTTLTFTTCRFKGNSRRGLSMYTGQECQFFGCIFEQNGEEGLYVNLSGGGGGSAAIQNILVQAGYFEANQQSVASGSARHATYHAYVRGTKVKFRDAFFAHAADGTPYTDEARAVQLDNAFDFLVDHCDVAAEAGQISVIGSSSGIFVNWPEGNGGIDTVVADTTSYGSVSLLYEHHNTFTPVLTFATPGNLSVSYANQTGRWSRIGNRVTVQVVLQTSTFTYTTASGVLRITGLPYTSKNATNNDNIGAAAWQGINKTNYTNIVAHVAANSSYVDFIASGSAQPAANISASDTPSGGTVILEFTITYEI